jgi:hypothetical protein
MPTPYTLDNQLIPGEIVISFPGHPCYIAGTMHTAEVFAKRLTGDTPIELPAETDSTRDERISRTVARVLYRIAVDGLAQALITTRETIQQHAELREAQLA